MEKEHRVVDLCLNSLHQTQNMIFDNQSTDHLVKSFKSSTI